jgi:hypothetical protein
MGAAGTADSGGGRVSLGTAVTEILEPFVGRTVADTCVRATALSLGKTADDLTGDDLPALDANIRRLLAPITPSNTIDAIIGELARKAV